MLLNGKKNIILIKFNSDEILLSLINDSSFPGQNT